MKKNISSIGVKYSTVLLFILGCLFYTKAQQAPLFSGYFFNKFLINPAFTGINNEYRLFGYYRTQWGSIPNRPVTGGVTAEGSFWNDRIGAGAQFMNDRAGIFNQNVISISYAQKIRIARQHILAIGISGSMNFNSINFTNAGGGEINDPNLGVGKTSEILYDLGLGISYSYKGLVAGFAVPNVLQPHARYKSATEKSSRYTFIRQYNAFIQYKIKTLHGKFNITPSFLMRKAETSGFQFEGTAAFDYNNMIFAGAGYRSTYGAVVFAGVRIKNIVTLAYAYDFTTQKSISSYVGSTHEITLGLHLPSNFKAKKAIDTQNTLPQSAGMDYETAATLKRNYDSLALALVVAEHLLDSLERVANTQRVTDSLSGTGNTQREKDSLTQIPKAQAHATNETATDKTFHKAESMTQALETGKKDMKGRAIKLDKISFEYKKATLKEESYGQLNGLAGYLRQHSNAHITIRGYTDSIGSDLYNMDLSQKRAKSVRDYLFNHGVESERINFIGMAESDPIAANGTEEGREQNRRVEFVIEE